jgi:hypothetical protein
LQDGIGQPVTRKVIVHDDAVPLSELSARIDDTPKASLFRRRRGV